VRFVAFFFFLAHTATMKTGMMSAKHMHTISSSMFLVCDSLNNFPLPPPYLNQSEYARIHNDQFIPCFPKSSFLVSPSLFLFFIAE